MDVIMARPMNGCMTHLVVRWTDRLMPLRQTTDRMDSLVNGWVIRCLSG